MDAKETQDAIRRLRHGYGNWFDWEKIEEHIRLLTEELARKDKIIVQLRAEVDAHDRALQQRDANTRFVCINGRCIPERGTVDSTTGVITWTARP